jgi:hypothetical protein
VELSRSIARRVPRPLVTALFATLGRLAIVGMLAIGASGLLAWAMGATFGKAFVAGDPPGVTYTAERCADLAEYAPGAKSCEEAAVVHHFGETVDYRLAAGVLGLLAIGPFVWIRRRLRAGTHALPRGFEATIGTAVFGLAAGGLLLAGLGTLTEGASHGAGAYLSGGILALGVAIAYAVSFWRALVGPRA